MKPDASSQLTATCSLPRQKRRGDMSPSPNVAIVSPMPSLKRPQRAREEELKKEDSEDPLRGIAPMAPLGLFRGRQEVKGRVEVGSMQTVNTAIITGSSGEVIRHAVPIVLKKSRTSGRISVDMQCLFGLIQRERHII